MSIQRYLLIVILSVVTLASFGAALQGYKASKAKLNHVFDEEMRSFAIALLHSPIKQSSTNVVLHSIFAYQIWIDNKLSLKSHNSPDKHITKNNKGYSDSSFLGKRWRVFVLVEGSAKVVVAQPVEQRLESVEEVLLEAILPIVYAIPLIGLLVFFAINRSLKPLHTLSKQLQEKSANDLTAIQVKENSTELKPIEQTLNSLFERLTNAFEREKRLSSDAAHELRTPISVLKITAHNIKTAFENNSIERHHINELHNNTIRMAHVIEQIIALNRTTPESFSESKTTLALRELLQSVISENYDQIELAQQTVSLEAKPISLLGDKFSLEVLFDNLLKNAIKYSGNGTNINIAIKEHQHDVQVIVEDSGVGITKEHLDKVFLRFYRVKQHSETGSGLGLSIVKHIVDLHEGNIQLMASDLGGLKVAITLPKVMSLDFNNA
ncbi:ATP-binding protein [Cognaticolwellia mytili]|uniref:ATP-binding protein n=1 Tax=Cognaticolwellia mytili TaxID=1888913 RepID=UPI000A17054F|nr:ATP-binding protein [Cognaticolwellia mytili]